MEPFDETSPFFCPQRTMDIGGKLTLLHSQNCFFPTTTTMWYCFPDQPLPTTLCCVSVSAYVCSIVSYERHFSPLPLFVPLALVNQTSLFVPVFPVSTVSWRKLCRCLCVFFLVQMFFLSYILRFFIKKDESIVCFLVFSTKFLLFVNLSDHRGASVTTVFSLTSWKELLKL